jgi:hypothetical protein
MLAIVKDDPNSIRVINVQTLAVRAAFVGPPRDTGLQTFGPALSDDGSYLAAGFYLRGGGAKFDFRCWHVDSGRLLPIPTQSLAPRFASGGRVLIVFGAPTGLIAYHVDGAQVAYSLLGSFHQLLLLDDGRTLAVAQAEIADSFLKRWASKMGFGSWFDQSLRLQIRLLEAETGRELGIVPAGTSNRFRPMLPGMIHNRQVLVIRDPENYQLLRFWDIPPQKPLSWFILGAAALAVAIAYGARRRLRRLGAATLR